MGMVRASDGIVRRNGVCTSPVRFRSVEVDGRRGLKLLENHHFPPLD